VDVSETRNWLRLALTPGVVPCVSGTLVDYYGSPDVVLGMSKQELREVPGLRPKVIDALLETADGKREAAVNSESELLQSKGVSLLAYDDSRFPPLLKQIPDPPGLLFFRGELGVDVRSTFAVVGTRRCDAYGLSVTRDFVGALARSGLTIVSGLALGIDGAAHKAALSQGAATWAFLPCGFGQIYPPEHADLAEQITENGALLSEFTMSTPPLRSYFHPRNRLISGSSLGILVVQAAAKSGAMISARFGNEYNRDVFAVPGRANESNSEGPHRLIQDGAKLVHSPEDILEELGHRLKLMPVSANSDHSGSKPIKRSPRKKESTTGDPLPSAKAPDTADKGRKPDEREEVTDPLDKKIVLRLEHGPVHIDRLCGDLDIPVRKLSERLLILEMKGIVQRKPGMSFDLA